MKRPIAFITLFLLISSCSMPVVLPPLTSSGALEFEEHLKLGNVYESKGMLSDALKQYRKAAALRPEDSRPWFGVGNIHLKAYRYDLAEKNFLKAIEIDNTKGYYYNNLSWVYIYTGNLAGASAMATEALIRDPQRRYIYLDTMGVIEMRSRNFVAAESIFKEAITFAPPTEKLGLTRIYGHLYELYSITGNTKKAEEARAKLDELRLMAPLPQ